jgi:hypothetical protein
VLSSKTHFFVSVKPLPVKERRSAPIHFRDLGDESPSRGMREYVGCICRAKLQDAPSRNYTPARRAESSEKPLSVFVPHANHEVAGSHETGEKSINTSCSSTPFRRKFGFSWLYVTKSNESICNSMKRRPLRVPELSSRFALEETVDV